jgi:hypothetical protein
MILPIKNNRVIISIDIDHTTKVEIKTENPNAPM